MLRKSEDFITRLLIGSAFMLILVIALGTVLSFSINHDNTGIKYRIADPAPQKVINLSNKTNSQLNAFTDLGQIRAVTKSPDGKTSGTVVIITPWFSYPAEDRTLYEELSQKSRKEKNIIMEYFADYTAEELRYKGERKIKEDLVALINDELVLGKIKNIYFDNYLFIE